MGKDLDLQRETEADFYCITCSDVALPVKVLSVSQENGMALVSVGDATEEVDISLVDSVGPGDVLLVHGGVALANQGKD